MNAIVIRSTEVGEVDLDVQTDPTDPQAAAFAQWLYKMIAETETRLTKEVAK